MFERLYYPSPSPPYSGFYRRPLLNPFRGVVGPTLALSGLVVIAHWLSPHLVEELIPGWRSRYGSLVAVGVALGFLRCILRLFGPLLSLGFWAIALCALIHSYTSGAFMSHGSLPVATEAVRAVIPEAASPVTGKGWVGSKSLPESAYFPAPAGGERGPIPKNFLSSTLSKLLR